jgi:predicted TIM-barrel fold metal-dependent hydrolase
VQAAPGGARRQVVVSGKRVKTIDVHAHCVIPEALPLMGLKLENQRGPGLGEVGARRISEMDAQGIDVEALSINPTWYKAERDLAAEIIKIQNNKLAEFCATYPDRFVAFASVALQYPDLAVEQLEHGVKKLGLRGAAVGASVAGDEFSDAKFHPFWAKAEELGVLIFIHPQSTPELAKRFKGNGWLSNTIGNPLDTTIALSHLIFEGTLDRFPGLKICSAHGGGFLPSYAPRSGQLPARGARNGYGREAEEEAHRVPADDVLRHARIYVGNAAAPRRGGGGQPARCRHRSSHPMAPGPGDAHHERAGLQRRRAARDAGGDGGEAAGDKGVTTLALVTTLLSPLVTRLRW